MEILLNQSIIYDFLLVLLSRSMTNALATVLSRHFHGSECLSHSYLECHFEARNPLVAPKESRSGWVG